MTDLNKAALERAGEAALEVYLNSGVGTTNLHLEMAEAFLAALPKSAALDHDEIVERCARVAGEAWMDDLAAAIRKLKVDPR